MKTMRNQMKKWIKANGYEQPAKQEKIEERKSSKKLPVAPKERLSERDLKELMGINRTTYQRRRGSLRQR
jgi:hypothetical protein